MSKAAVVIIGTFPAAQLCHPFCLHFLACALSLEPGFLEYFGLLYDWPIEVTMPDCLVIALSLH